MNSNEIKVEMHFLGAIGKKIVHPKDNGNSLLALFGFFQSTSFYFSSSEIYSVMDT